MPTRSLQTFGPALVVAACLLAGIAAPITGSEFTVRWADEEAEPRAGGTVSLHAPCAPYECGLDLLSGTPAPGPAFQGSFKAGGLFRGQATEGDGWWVVVQGAGRMPMALLWRPPVAAGYLPAAPAMEARACSVTVRDADGAGIEGATVAAEFSIEEEERRGNARRSRTRPSVFGDWRPWSPLLRTDRAGRAVVLVPVQGVATLRVGASGRQTLETTCVAGESTVLELERRDTPQVLHGPDRRCRTAARRVAARCPWLAAGSHRGGGVRGPSRGRG